MIFRNVSGWFPVGVAGPGRQMGLDSGGFSSSFAFTQDDNGFQWTVCSKEIMDGGRFGFSRSFAFARDDNGFWCSFVGLVSLVFLRNRFNRFPSLCVGGWILWTCKLWFGVVFQFPSLSLRMTMDLLLFLGLVFRFFFG